jgi:hypothetical protein
MTLKENLNSDILFQPFVIPNLLNVNHMNHMNDNTSLLVQYKNEDRERVTTNIPSLFSQTDNTHCSHIC